MAFQEITGLSDGITALFFPAVPLSSSFLGDTTLSLLRLAFGDGNPGLLVYYFEDPFEAAGLPALQFMNGGGLEYQKAGATIRLRHAGLASSTRAEGLLQANINLRGALTNSQLPPTGRMTFRFDDGVGAYADVAAEFAALGGVSLDARVFGGAIIRPEFAALGGVSLDARVEGPPSPKPVFHIPLDVRVDAGINSRDVAAAFRVGLAVQMSAALQHDRSVAASLDVPMDVRMTARVIHDKTVRPGVIGVPMDVRVGANLEGTKTLRPTIAALGGVSIDAGVTADRHVRAEFAALAGVRIAARIPREYVDIPAFYRLDADTGVRFATHEILEGQALEQALYDRMAVPLGYRRVRPGYGAGPFEATPHPDDAAISLRAALLSDPQVLAVSHQVSYQEAGARIDFAVTADVNGEPTDLALSVAL